MRSLSWFRSRSRRAARGVNNERTARTLRIALASFDLKELRVQKNYLQEQSPVISCSCFRNGQKLLDQLRQGVRYNAIVLCGEMDDMSAEQFSDRLQQLEERPELLISDESRRGGETVLQTEPRDGCYYVCRMELKKLLWQIYRMPGQQNQQLEQQCSQLYESWGIEPGDINATYLSRAVSIVCSTSQKMAIRKEILQTVSEQFDTSVTAVDSGIRRMVDQLEANPSLAWTTFKAETGLGGGKPTTGKLIYAVKSFVLRQKTEK